MELDEKYVETLFDAHRLLKEAETRLARIVAGVPELSYEDFDLMCETLNTAAARLRYVRVFIEPGPDDSSEFDDTLS